MSGFPFLLKAEYTTAYTQNDLFNHLFANVHLGHLQLLATVNNATMNTGIQISVWVSASTPLGYISRSEIVGS